MSLHYSTSLKAMVGSLLNHRELLWDLIKRDFVGRYKGSIMGVAWSLLNPILMLIIYTLVFSVAFKARWGVGDESQVSFALVLFSGMMVHGLLAECLNRAPSIILDHPSYVTKVVFPLEILPLVALCSALLHFTVSLGLLLVFCVYSGMSLTFSVLYAPIIMLPLILMAIGLTWAISALGVYLRDISQVMTVLTTVLMFLSPVFYKTTAFPETYRALFDFNPLTLPIEQLRNVVLWDKPINWESWMISLVVGIAVCYVGFWWFQKSRKGFADVL